VLTEADPGLCAAKAAGRNTVRTAEPRMSAAAPQDIPEQDLPEAQMTADDRP